MASFEKALTTVGRNEGGYVLNKDDAGGETYKGISRYHHPSWPGWTIIDTVPLEQRTDVTLGVLPLSKLVDDFYRVEFWEKLRMYDAFDQCVAEAIYDTAVLFGTYRAAMWTQASLNTLNGAGSWPDIEVDGIIGRATIATLNIACGDKAQRNRFMECLISLRISEHIHETVARDKSRYAMRGWIDRAVRMRNG